MKVNLIVLLFVFLPLNNVLANTAPYYNNTANAINERYLEVQQLMNARESVYHVITTLNGYSNARMTNKQAMLIIRTKVLPLFNFNTMVQNIIGNRTSIDNIWLKRAITNDIITTIMQNLHKVKHYQFTPKSVYTQDGNIVLSFIVRGMNIDLMMHNTEGSWKIIDVAINNYGLTQYYQQKFLRI